MKDTYIFDLDGTLSIVGDRIKYLNQDKPDWDAFYDECGEDELNEGVADIYKILEAAGCVIHVITGRRASCYDNTIAWFKKHKLPTPDSLSMRNNDDYRHDTIVKPGLLISNLGCSTGNVIAIFADRDSMVKKWRELGYTCLQVAEGDF